MNGVTWSILGLIVVLLVWVVIEWRRQQRTTVPAAVKAVRDFYPEITADRDPRMHIECGTCGERFNPQTPAGKRAFVRHEGSGDSIVHRIGYAGPDTHVCGVDCDASEHDPLCAGSRAAVPAPVVDVPKPAKHSRDIFDRVGADANWATDLAAVPAGELLPAGIPTVSIDDIPDAELIRPGTPTVSIDDFTDEELWEASFGADLRRLDDALEAARRLCTANLVAAGMPLALMQQLDRRDAESHERALDHATVLTTSEFPAVPTSVKRRPDCGPRARRDRKRANRALGR